MLTKPRVAVLGTGIMGMAMARNMLRAGLRVSAWNRTRARALPLVEDGATLADTPAEAARGANVIVTMLSDGAAVEAAMTGPGGAQPALGSDSIWIQMSTVGVEATNRLSDLARAAGIGFVDAPVLGTRAPAEQGHLTILGSGPESLRDQCAPVFEAVGVRTAWVGAAGAGTRMKLVANQWSVGMVGVLSETIAVASILGVDPAQYFAIIDGGAFSVPYAQTKSQMMIAREFRPSFPLDMAHKDLRLVLEAARAAGRSLPVTAAIQHQYAVAEASGCGRSDLSAVITALDP